MIYNVFSGTLNPAQSQSLDLLPSCLMLCGKNSLSCASCKPISTGIKHSRLKKISVDVVGKRLKDVNMGCLY